MPQSTSHCGEPRNRLLALLPETGYRRTLPHFQHVTLAFSAVPYDATGPIHYAYFPIATVLSALIVM